MVKLECPNIGINTVYVGHSNTQLNFICKLHNRYMRCVHKRQKKRYRNKPMQCDRHAWANGTNPCHITQDAVSDQGLHYSPLIQHFFLRHTTDSKINIRVYFWLQMMLFEVPLVVRSVALWIWVSQPAMVPTVLLYPQPDDKYLLKRPCCKSQFG